MSLFKNLKSEGLEQTEDRLGGGFTPVNTDIYTGKLVMAYAGAAQSGAQNVTLVFKHDGKEYKETVYITNRSGNNYFLNKSDQTKKVPMLGFTIIDDLCQIITGKPLCEQDTEEKVIKEYDYDLKAEANKSVHMLMDILDQEVSMAIVKQVVSVNEKNADGEYVPNGKTREENAIEKIFHTESKLTVPEARAGKEKGTFWDAWLEKNKDQVRDKTKKVAATGMAGKPAPTPGADTKPRQSLFGKKS